MEDFLIKYIPLEARCYFYKFDKPHTACLANLQNIFYFRVEIFQFSHIDCIFRFTTVENRGKPQKRQTNKSVSMLLVIWHHGWEACGILKFHKD
jgi:hypothetical protein